ncbi:hypothetical protein BV882_37080 [Streptomyces sp. 46]|nr:hypothetical protein BV882_37080 [Streptomyces sp. 46]
MTCCWTTEEPSRSHGMVFRASVSIRSSCAGPHVRFSPVARLCRYTAFDLATPSFHSHRHRSHSVTSALRAVEDTRSRKV